MHWRTAAFEGLLQLPRVDTGDIVLPYRRYGRPGMKTTIELPDELLEQARRVARSEGATLRSLVEEGLHRTLEARRRTVVRELDFPSYGGSGFTTEFQGAPWSRIRDEVYSEHGA